MLVSLTAVGLIVAGIATYASLRSFLVDRVDRTVTAGAAGDRALARARQARPGRPRRARRGEPGHLRRLGRRRAAWSAGRPIGTRPGETPLPQPDLSAERRDAAAADGGDPFTVSAVSGDTRFRVQLEPLGDGGQMLVVAAPLDEVDDTLHQLLVVELVVAGSVLARDRCSRVSGSSASACGRSGGSSRRRRRSRAAISRSGSRTTTRGRRSAGSAGR